MDTPTTTTAMSSVISALTNASTGLNASTMFGVVADLVPFIVMIVPVALGVYFLRKLLKVLEKQKLDFNLIQPSVLMVLGGVGI